MTALVFRSHMSPLWLFGVFTLAPQDDGVLVFPLKGVCVRAVFVCLRFRRFVRFVALKSNFQEYLVERKLRKRVRIRNQKRIQQQPSTVTPTNNVGILSHD